MIERIQDPGLLFDHFSQDVYLNLYNICDLEGTNWGESEYYSMQTEEEGLESVVLIHKALVVPIVAAMSHSRFSTMPGLLTGLSDRLPSNFYGNFTVGLADLLEGKFSSQSYGDHYRMGLVHPEMLGQPGDRIRPVDPNLEDQVSDLIHRNMSDYWYNPKMLDSGYYFGYFDGSVLIGVGGIHVIARAYGVAALGNIVTDADHRRKGVAQQIVSAICLKLLESVDYIGLNVRCDNTPAIKCYEKLGFEITHRYQEYMMIKRP